MRHHAHLTALAALVLAACAPACGRDAPHEHVGGAEEPGLSRGSNPKPIPTPYEVARAWLKEHPGKCGVACFDAWAGTCSALGSCADAEPDDLITCGSNTYLSCEAARDATAGTGWPSGLDACAHICEDLQR
jgi:hypothetical protein